MKISYKWLCELSGVNWPVEKMAEKLTLAGIACEYLEPTDQYMDKVVVGAVTAVNPIEGASKIKLATVNLGRSSQDVVCGAPNVAVGQKVPVALEGARLFGDIVIQKTKIRGIESSAMICSERELGISDDHSGIMVLDGNFKSGTPLAEALDYRDYIMTFELTPNRADAMSAIGIARDLAALAGGKVSRPQFELKESSEKAREKVKVSIEDTFACPRYAARFIRNIKVGPSPWWLQKRLITAGMRPINNVVDITNFVMLECGHPLHAFDYDRFGSDKVIVRRAREGEPFTTLDNQDRKLTSEILLITNGRKGVAVGGIMGGLDSEVEPDTVNLLLEAAYFNPTIIRRGRKNLNLSTESSSRFERGADPNSIEYALNRTAFLLQELCGGEILGGIVDCYPSGISPRQITLRVERCRKVMGVGISAERIKQILRGLEFEVEERGDLHVTVPTFRPDIEREIDLIEEVARIEGYDSIPDATVNVGPLYTPEHYEDHFRRDIRHILTASGYDEMVHHGLVDSKLSEILYPARPYVRILNPVADDLNIMRHNLIQTTLSVINHNLNHRNLDLAFFEIGTAYHPTTDTQDWGQTEKLALAVTGESPHTWRERPRQLDFYDVTGALNKLSLHFGWGTFEYIPVDISFLEPEISFEVSAKGKTVGFVGKTQMSILKKFDIKQPVYIAEFELDQLLALSGQLKQYQPLSVYPAAPRDLAIVVEEQVKAADLVAIIKEAAGRLAEEVSIFDLYDGKQIESGKKSIAISVIYRSSEGSLLAEQVDELQQSVVALLKRKFNAEIRDK